MLLVFLHSSLTTLSPPILRLTFSSLSLSLSLSRLSGTDGMELYSTTLWHLKKEVELSFLAQQLSQYGKRSAQVWCVVGNCFSNQKEHDLALKFFQRAIQLDPRFTYAYTLSGHEYQSNEDFDKAIECYRHAVRVDDRHYNAWYGLGSIYYRQEKYDIAEYHFRKGKLSFAVI